MRNGASLEIQVKQRCIIFELKIYFQLKFNSVCKISAMQEWTKAGEITFKGPNY